MKRRVEGAGSRCQWRIPGTSLVRTCGRWKSKVPVARYVDSVVNIDEKRLLVHEALVRPRGRRSNELIAGRSCVIAAATLSLMWRNCASRSGCWEPSLVLRLACRL